MSRKIASILETGKGFYVSFKRIVQLKSHNETTETGRSDERYRRILLSGGSAFLVKIVSVAINLISVPLTLNYLGAERYGLWMAISSLMALMAFADLGLGNGLLNAVSEAKGKQDKASAQIAVSSTFFMLLFVALVLAIAFLIIYPYVSWPSVFNVQTEVAKKEAGRTMMALIIPLLINMPLGIVQRIQEGNQEGFRYQLFLIAGSVFSFIGTLLCIYFKEPLPWLVLTVSFGPILATLLNGFVLFTKYYNYLTPSLRFFRWKESRLLIQSGLVFFLLTVFTLVSNSSDNIIIAQTLGATHVAGYEIVKKMFLFSMMTQFVIQPLWPAFNEAMAKGDYYWVKKTLKKAMMLSIGFGGIITLPLLLFGRPIIHLWVGSAFVPDWWLLIGFYLFIFLSNFGGVMSTFFNSGNLVKRQTVFIGLAAITSILMKIFLAHKVGVSGVIWGGLIGYIIFYVYPTCRIASSYFKKLGV